ncbi:MAG: TlpA disulfide reductase family protein [Thermodesulfovibrionia bacterium]|nr:TlpA disulfide reductase family protein [Thermodesulfovibrionia bacterium]
MKNVFRIILLVFTLLSVTLLLSVNLDAQLFSPFEVDKLVGKKAPEFKAKDLSGNSVSLSSFKGKPILLNFWATWCPYCREERPYLNSLHKEYKDKGLVIISVSLDKSEEPLRKFLKKTPSDFIILHDNDNAASGPYGVYSLPTSFTVDRNGIIKGKFLGARNWTDSNSKKVIEELIK